MFSRRSTLLAGRRSVVVVLAVAMAACAVRGTDSAERPRGDLHSAAWDGRLEDLRALLAAGQPVETKEGPEWTPLHYAAIAGRTGAATLLLDHGADPGARGRLDMTPLHWAALKGRAEVAALLIRRGARVDARNIYGGTPLHEAADEAVVDALLAGGANIHAVDFQGMTPLHVARNGRVARLLMARGADIRLRSRDGRTGMDVAVAESLEPEGLMFYGPRASARLRGARGRIEVTVRNISERSIEDLTVTVQSRACTGVVTPATVARFWPAEAATLTVDLAARPGVPRGEYPLAFTVSARGVRLGEFDLRVDSSPGVTPEDLGMTRLGTAKLRQAPSRWQYLAYAAAPVLLAGIWLVLRRRR